MSPTGGTAGLGVLVAKAIRGLPYLRTWGGVTPGALFARGGRPILTVVGTGGGAPKMRGCDELRPTLLLELLELVTPLEQTTSLGPTRLEPLLEPTMALLEQTTSRRAAACGCPPGGEVVGGVERGEWTTGILPGPKPLQPTLVSGPTWTMASVLLPEGPGLAKTSVDTGQLRPVALVKT